MRVFEYCQINLNPNPLISLLSAYIPPPIQNLGGSTVAFSYLVIYETMWVANVVENTLTFMSG